MTKPIEINDADFEREVLEAGLPVIVDFWAEWCGPCHAMAPILDDLAGEYDGWVKFVKIDTKENFDVMSRYGIRGLPTLLIFDDGEPVDRITGGRSKEYLRQALQKALG